MRRFYILYKTPLFSNFLENLSVGSFGNIFNIGYGEKLQNLELHIRPFIVSFMQCKLNILNVAFVCKKGKNVYRQMFRDLLHPLILIIPLTYNEM